MAGAVAAALVPLVVVGAPAPASRAAPGGAAPSRTAPSRTVLWGVTVNDVAHPGVLTSALAALPERPVTRIYFSVQRPASYYAPAVTRIRRVSAVLGELLDSSESRAITVAAFTARVASYLQVLGRRVAIWEVGNEVNGNWTGPYPAVAAKLTTAYDQVTAAGGRTALTLYANNFGPGHCGDGAAELTPMQFTRRYVPARVARGLSYVFLSYYPANCGGRQPDPAQLARSLRRLHALYPGAALGIGETGTPEPATPASLATARQIMRWAYSLNPRLPYYAGGYFWWYAAEDALGPHALLRAALATAFRAETRALSP